MLENAPPSASEVRALAQQLLAWAEVLSAPPAAGHAAIGEERHELALSLAIVARESARLRDAIFAGIGLGNPAWDIALELFIQEADGQRTEPERLALLTYLPSETVARGLERLARAGLVETLVDPFDRRRHWPALTADGQDRMTELLVRSARLAWPLPIGHGDQGQPATA